MWNLDLIGEKLTAAAFDSQRWPEALDCIASQTGARGAIILPVTGKLLPNVAFGDQLAKAAEVYFRDEWHLRDVRYRVSMPRWIREGVIDDFDCVSADDMQSSPYYQEFLSPVGLRWFAGVKMAAGDDFWCLSINRGIDQSPFSPDEKRKLAQLSGIASTAAAFAQAVGFSAAKGALEAFDVSSTAVVLIDRKAEVVRANRTAEILLKGDVRIVRRRIFCPSPSSVAALDQALHKLLRTPAGASLMPPVALSRESRPPILAYPLKLPSLAASFAAEAQGAVVLIDPASGHKPPAATLQEAFKLTPTEARLASLMATGDSLDSICDVLEISKETGRNHLKAIFAKTGVHRQGELIRMIVRLL
ncbi:MAG TPA: helix-turn-helix transcriptional regulator [Nitrobacter sp.]|jgi:DNA-binding CsgD family transcriptional regulator|nr:helix-turn-helix transcriptional regulator [Nitrobacter sp.]